MKTTLLTLIALCLFSSVGVSAQLIGGYRDSEAHPLVLPSHEQHANQGTPLPQRNLYVGSTTLIAVGDRPLWEFAQPPAEIPLGDVARLLRQQHATAKKAVKILEK